MRPPHVSSSRARLAALALLIGPLVACGGGGPRAAAGSGGVGAIGPGSGGAEGPDGSGAARGSGGTAASGGAGGGMAMNGGAGAGGSTSVGSGGAGGAGGTGGGGGVATGGQGMAGACASSAMCPAPLVCERIAGPACADPDWAEWPMPNDAGSGAPNRGSYTDNGDDTITDGVTGLMWQKTVSTRQNVWDDAVAYCASLPLAGHADWRLPTRIELVSLLDLSKVMPPNIDDVFAGAPAAAFWTATPLATDPTFYAWSVTLFDGLVSPAEKVLMQYARCVR